MSDLVPPYIDALVPYVPGKPVEELERELGIRGAVKLASNENPLGPSPLALEAIRRAAGDAHRYPDGAAFRLRTAIAELHGTTREHVTLGNGSNELIDLVTRTFASPSDHGVIVDPSFLCYGLALTTANVPYSVVPMPDGLHHDVDAMLAAVRPATKLVFLANPNNPTGTHVGRDDLARLARELPARVLLVVDEAYVEFADAPDFASALELRALRERLVVLRTFSKAYGLASLRVGYAVAGRDVISYLDRVRMPFNVSGVGQAAALAALRDPEHLARAIAMNARERSRVSTELTARGARVAPSQTNFVLAKLAMSGRAAYEAMLPRGVIVRPMPKPIDAWTRISIGLPDENDRLLRAVDEVMG